MSFSCTPHHRFVEKLKSEFQGNELTTQTSSSFLYKFRCGIHLHHTQVPGLFVDALGSISKLIHVYAEETINRCCRDNSWSELTDDMEDRLPFLLQGCDFGRESSRT
jgi:hypothetical protein